MRPRPVEHFDEPAAPAATTPAVPAGRIPFPLPGGRTPLASNGSITLDANTARRLDMEGLYLYVRLVAAYRAGDELSVENIAAEWAFRGIDRAEQWLSDIDCTDMIDWQAPAALDLHGVDSMAELLALRPHERQMHREARREYLRQFGPTEPDGSWKGPWPLTGSTRRPPRGQSVVYLLEDQGAPVYVGSTSEFVTRMGNHRRDGKVWTTWTAYPHATREDAYAAESAYLAQYMPALNVQGPRR